MFDNLDTYFSVNPINGGNELINIDYFTTTDIIGLEEEIGRGLYAWYLIPPPYGDNSALKSYHKLFWEKQYETDVKSKFGELYSGKLDYELSKQLDKKISALDFTKTEHQKILRMSSLMFSQPLYIGRSTELKDRLNVHIKELRKYLENPIDFERAFEDVKIELDTEEESASFAKRITSYLYESLGKESFKNKVSLNHFIVKVINIKSEEFNDDNIVDMEYYLNRTFRPIIGNK